MSTTTRFEPRVDSNFIPVSGFSNLHALRRVLANGGGSAHRRRRHRLNPRERARRLAATVARQRVATIHAQACGNGGAGHRQLRKDVDGGTNRPRVAARDALHPGVQRTRHRLTRQFRSLRARASEQRRTLRLDAGRSRLRLVEHSLRFFAHLAYNVHSLKHFFQKMLRKISSLGETHLDSTNVLWRRFTPSLVKIHLRCPHDKSKSLVVTKSKVDGKGIPNFPPVTEHDHIQVGLGWIGGRARDVAAHALQVVLAELRPRGAVGGVSGKFPVVRGVQGRVAPGGGAERHVHAVAGVGGRHAPTHRGGGAVRHHVLVGHGHGECDESHDRIARRAARGLLLASVHDGAHGPRALQALELAGRGGRRGGDRQEGGGEGELHHFGLLLGCEFLRLNWEISARFASEDVLVLTSVLPAARVLGVPVGLRLFSTLPCAAKDMIFRICLSSLA